MGQGTETTSLLDLGILFCLDQQFWTRRPSGGMVLKNFCGRVNRINRIKTAQTVDKPENVRIDSLSKVGR